MLEFLKHTVYWPLGRKNIYGSLRLRNSLKLGVSNQTYCPGIFLTRLYS